MTAATDTYDHLFKLLLVGDSNVGKTSLLLSFTTDSYKDNVRNTVGVDLKVKIVKHPATGKTLKLTIWDTAGQERFRTLTSAYYRGAQGIILVYDVTNRDSFVNIKHWLNEVDIYSTNEECVRMLVGNKVDLADESEGTTSKRAVSRKEGSDFARQHNMLFVEASAKTQTGVKQAFEEVCSKILDKPSVANGGSTTPQASSAGRGLRLTDDDEDTNQGSCMSCVRGSAG